MPTLPEALVTNRSQLITRLAEPRHDDVAIVGGGATGLGVALDAAARGFSVALVGAILLQETGLDPQVEAFTELAEHYLCLPASCERVNQPRFLSADATEAQVLADPGQTSQQP